MSFKGRMNAELAQYVYPKRKADESPTTRAFSSFRRGCVEIVLTPSMEALDSNALGERESGSRATGRVAHQPDLVIETSYSA